MFTGSMVALITPFTKDGQVNEDKFRELVERQIEQGTDVLVPCGTTGESATLNYDEHNQVIKACIEQAKGRVPVMTGTGANSTSEALELSRQAHKLGADGLLLVCPYYNKPSPEGVYQHYKTLAESVPLPQVMYNVPGRTGINMSAETTVRLAQIDNIVGIKEASGNATQASEIISKAGDKISVISGDDFMTLPLMAVGGVGVISVSANVVPERVKSMVQAFRDGNFQEAQQQHLHMLAFHQAMFMDANPVPVKTAASFMGLCELSLRLPLVPMSANKEVELRNIMQNYGLL